MRIDEDDAPVMATGDRLYDSHALEWADVAAWVRVLPDREADVLEITLRDGCTARAASAAVGVSVRQVRYLRRLALARILRAMRAPSWSVEDAEVAMLKCGMRSSMLAVAVVDAWACRSPRRAARLHNVQERVVRYALRRLRDGVLDGTIDPGAAPEMARTAAALEEISEMRRPPPGVRARPGRRKR